MFSISQDHRTRGLRTATGDNLQLTALTEGLTALPHHRVVAIMNGIEEEVIEKKDLSRPFFPRKPGKWVLVALLVREVVVRLKSTKGSNSV